MRLDHRLLLVAVVLLSGCSASVGDLGPYVTSERACRMDGNRATTRDLRARLSELVPHMGHRMQLDVVLPDEANPLTGRPRLRSRIVMDVLGPGTQDLVVERAVPPGDFRLDFWADNNGNGALDPQPTDHQWFVPVCSDGAIFFPHNFDFNEVIEPTPIGNDLVFSLTNVPAALQTERVEARVVFDAGEDSERTVGTYRQSVVGAATDFEIPGILDDGSPFVLLWFVDLDDDLLASEGDMICGLAVPAPVAMSGVVTVAADMAASRCDLMTLDASALL